MMRLRRQTPSPSDPAVTLAVDCLAAARLTRFVVKDTVPFGAARDWILARYPNVGGVLDPSLWEPDEDPDRPMSAGPDPAPAVGERHRWYRVGGYGKRTVVAQGAPSIMGGARYVVIDEHSKIGELITCPWCAGAWLSAAVLAARYVAPRAWDPVGRALAASAVTGWLTAHLG